MTRSTRLGASADDLSAAAGAEPATGADAPGVPSAADGQTPEQTPEQAREEARAKRRRREDQDDRRVFGVYLSADAYTEMKAAYLSDWALRRGDADTLYRWVAAAISAHAARSAGDRATSAPAGEKRAKTRTGATKAFKLPADVYQRMQDAMGDDERAGRWTSESAWAVEAITHAAEAARAANGGTLPDPPVRLPNRLKRR